MNDPRGNGLVLSFGKVRKEFRGFLPRRRVVALESLDMEVHAGEIVGLVGPNGSGKTTSFRLAAGLLKADRGALSVFGMPPGSRAARALVGYMPEQPGVPPALTPAELLHFVGRVHGMPAGERRDRVDELTALLSLSGFLKRPMAGFSKGMIKRVGLAAALFARPRLLLLDEPLEGIDPLGSAKVKEYLHAFARGGGSVLVSSHILSDIEGLCSTLFILSAGRVILSGPRDDILSLRDMIEVRMSAPEEADLLAAVEELVEKRGGRILYAGRPRENLESLFRRLLGPERGGKAGP